MSRRAAARRGKLAARAGGSRRRHTGMVPLGFAALFALMAGAPGLFTLPSPATHDPGRCSIRRGDGRFQDLLSPSRQHWFGTDTQGCDVFARVVHGARVSVTIGIGAVLIASVVGALVGGLAALAGGRVDGLASRVIDTTLGIPPIVLAILLLSTRDHRTLGLVTVVIGSLGVPAAARIARASCMEILHRTFIESARASGASPARVLLRHVVPNAAPSMLAFASLSVGPAIAVESTAAFLGLSVDPPAAGWGVQVAEGRLRLFDHPYLLLLPMFFLVAATLTFVALGDGVQRWLDPRLGGSFSR